MILSATQEILRHYAFIMQSDKTNGVRKNFQKDYTLTQLEILDDPYLKKIDVNRFISTEPVFADIRYQQLTWIVDNYSQISKKSESDTYFKPQKLDKVGKKLAFVLWFQGEQEAPQLVKTNIQRIRKYLTQYELVVLTDSNLQEWIDIDQIPNYSNLREKFPANVSDLIRVKLLATYGGIWLDSTVVLNSNSENFLENALKQKSQFILRYGPYRIASWLIATKPFDKAMRWQYVALITWLKEKKAFIEYFQFHTFFEIFSMLDDSFINAEYLNAKNAFLLSEHWNKIISANDIQKIFELIPFQKLNYKINRNKVTPRTVEYLFENYLNPVSEEELKNIFLLPNGKDNLDEKFYISDVQYVIAKTKLDISSGVDFNKVNKVGEISKNQVIEVNHVSGTIAGTPRLKISEGYITANKDYVKKYDIKKDKSHSFLLRRRKKG